jgi:hypothetical protein
LQKREVSFEPISALEALNFALHDGDICREFEGRVIVEMDVVVGFAFDQLDALGVKRSSKILKRLVEKPRKQEQTGTLIESLYVNQHRARVAIHDRCEPT